MWGGGPCASPGGSSHSQFTASGWGGHPHWLEALCCWGGSSHMFGLPAPAPDGPLLAPGRHPSCPRRFPEAPHTSAPRLHPASSHAWCTSAVWALTGSVHREGWWGRDFLGQLSPCRALSRRANWGSPTETGRAVVGAEWRLWERALASQGPVGRGWGLPGISDPIVLRRRPSGMVCPAGESGRRRHGRCWAQTGGHRTGTAHGQQCGRRT